LLFRGKREHHLGAVFADRIRNGQQLIAFIAEQCRDLRMAGERWLRLPPPHESGRCSPSALSGKIFSTDFVR